MNMIKLIQGQPRVFAMDGPDRLKLELELPDAGSRLRTARNLLGALAGKAA
jgi:transcription-repair coupling factor (superfamily II helicase)